MSSRWWRAEETSIDHPKLLKLSDAMHRAWYILNCIASANDGVLPPTEDIAIRLRMKPTKVAEWITKLVAARLYDNDGGVFKPHNWDKRQYKTDRTDPTAPKRAKEYRDRKRDERDASRVTDRYDTVRDKRPEAEAKAETESEQSRADAGAPIDEDLKRKVAALQAGISAHFVSRQLKIPNLARCQDWLIEGIAAGTVLAAVEMVLKRGSKPSTMDYFEGPVRDGHAKAPMTAGIVVSNKVFVVEGTEEWNSHQTISFERSKRGTPVVDQRDESGRLTGRRGWYFPTLWAEGFNDFGERIAANPEEDAA